MIPVSIMLTSDLAVPAQAVRKAMSPAREAMCSPAAVREEREKFA